MTPSAALLTTEEVAEILRVSVSTIRRMCASGEIAASVPGLRGYRIPRSEVDRLLPRTAEPATELVWPHHYDSPDGASLCDWSGRPAAAHEEECPRGHELAPIAVTPLIPTGRAS